MCVKTYIRFLKNIKILYKCLKLQFVTIVNNNNFYQINSIKFKVSEF